MSRPQQIRKKTLKKLKARKEEFEKTHVKYKMGEMSRKRKRTRSGEVI